MNFCNEMRKQCPAANGMGHCRLPDSTKCSLKREEELEPEEIRISWEPVKESLDGILQRTVELVGLNPTRTDETWLWANTMAGALLEVIRKLEEEK